MGVCRRYWIYVLVLDLSLTFCSINQNVKSWSSKQKSTVIAMSQRFVLAPINLMNVRPVWMTTCPTWWMYLWHFISDIWSDNTDIFQQCRSIYARGNALIRIYYKCSDCKGEPIQILLHKSIYCRVTTHKLRYANLQ